MSNEEKSLFNTRRFWKSEEEFHRANVDARMPKTPEDTVSGNIRTWLKEARMTQVELAERLGVHPSQVSRWLNRSDDSLTWGTIRQIAEAISSKPGSGGIWPFMLCVPIHDEDCCNSFSVIRYLRRWVQSRQHRFKMILTLDALTYASPTFYDQLQPDGDVSEAVLMESRNYLRLAGESER